MKTDFSDSLVFKKLSSEFKEIQKIKWIESEKAKCDIGINRAIVIWVTMYQKNWWKNN